MEIYYETTMNDITIEHETLDDAIEYANANGIGKVYEIGGNWGTFERCWFCGEWVEENELYENDLCEYCHMEFKSRGEL